MHSKRPQREKELERTKKMAEALSGGMRKTPKEKFSKKYTEKMCFKVCAVLLATQNYSIVSRIQERNPCCFLSFYAQYLKRFSGIGEEKWKKWTSILVEFGLDPQFCSNDFFSEEEHAIVNDAIETVIHDSCEAKHARKAVEEEKRLQLEDAAKQKADEEEKKEEKARRRRERQEVAEAEAKKRQAEQAEAARRRREETDRVAQERQQEIEKHRKEEFEAKQAEREAHKAQILQNAAQLEAEKEKKRQDNLEKKRLKQFECLSPAQKRKLGADDDVDAPDEKLNKKGKK
jgi:phage-related minor tail protein